MIPAQSSHEAPHTRNRGELSGAEVIPLTLRLTAEASRRIQAQRAPPVKRIGYQSRNFLVYMLLHEQT